jgi:hypothetical protein
MLAVGAVAWNAAGQAAGADRLDALLVELTGAARNPTELSVDDVKRVERMAEAIDRAAAAAGELDEQATAQQALAGVDRLTRLKTSVDHLLDSTLSQRGRFAGIDPAERDRELIRRYIRTTARLLDLSARIRYSSFDAIDQASIVLSAEESSLERLVDLLRERSSSVGATVMCVYLRNPPADNPDGLVPASGRLKAKILRLIADAGDLESLPALADVLRDPTTSPAIKIYAAETIRRVGLPQAPARSQPAETPRPEITAQQVRAELAKLDALRLTERQRQVRGELLAWLEQRMRQGVIGDRYQMGRFQAAPGDWMLMRNPSPYNLFSDLSPGLFTHVGIVAATTDDDGVRRFVIVDLPERGTAIPATNLDAYVKRCLHYVLLRHEDDATARKMGEAAASIVGNPSRFDLNFRTERIEKLRGAKLPGRTIHTYCAGLLLLCAGQTEFERTHFFPIPERAAGGNMPANLARMGASIGDDFISPTGPMFSPHLRIAAGSESTYSPEREIEQAVFARFADGLRQRTLNVSLNVRQSLRLKLAEAAKNDPALARALAKAAGVNAEMDLAAAAKTAAVVETLDEVAYSASGQFDRAIEAIQTPAAALKPGSRGQPNDPLAPYRRRHADLVRTWLDGSLSPRGLRVELVRRYIQEGAAAIDARFFAPADNSP